MNLGKMMMTRGISEGIADDLKFAKEATKALVRYKNGDWGDMCDEDKQMNDEAVKHGNDRIFAAYNTSQGKIYIITEWDRSVTTILFADEY